MKQIWAGYSYQEFVAAWIECIQKDDSLSIPTKVKLIHKLGEYYIASGGNLDIKALVNITANYVYSVIGGA